jgi:hypothetical protein
MQIRPLWLALTIVVSATPARADDNIAKADQLFAEGRALMDTDLHLACAKFEESLAYNAQAIGTLLNVARCDEKLGRIATAVARFTEARDRAREQGMTVHVEAAEARLRELVPRVPHVTLRFSTPPVPDTQIVIDERVIGSAKLDEIAIDPGEHPVVVSAPGFLPFEAKIQVAEGEHRDVEIPALQRSITVRSSQRTIGKITAASGAAAITTGVVLGLVARSRYRREFEVGSGGVAPCVELADGKPQCDAAGYSATNSARTLGTVGTVVGVVGVAAVGVGVFLWLRGPRDHEGSGVSLAPQLDADQAGFVAVGHF